MANIILEKTSIYNPRVEIVERKGLGHPDTICDGIAESVSRTLSRYYLDEFGMILHHNVDKGLIIGGEARPEFGGGVLISPIAVIVAGRATKLVNGKRLPVDEIAREAVLEYLRGFKNLDPSIDVDIDVRLRQGSVDLTDVFSRAKSRPLANDTSFGVGFAPLTQLESLVLDLERYLNSDKFHSRYPWLGEDIKVMGLRTGDEYSVTVASAMVSRFVPDLDSYQEFKETLVREMEKFADSRGIPAEFSVNTADNLDPRNPSVYITVTGLSAEAGDDGQVGRGNRANGLITPKRPMSLEAVAGKNPVNHVGKIYNILANRIAQEIVKETKAENAYAFILSQIGKPINSPQILEIKTTRPTEKARYIAEYWLENLDRLTEEFVSGKIQIF